MFILIIKYVEVKSENTFVNIFFVSLSIFLGFYVLYIWASLIIPFIIAILFSFAIVWVADFYKKFKIPPIISMILSLLTYVLIFFAFWRMVNSSLWDFIELLPTYEAKLYDLYISLLNYFKIYPSIDAYTLFQKIDLTNMFSSVFSSVTSIFSSIWLIFFYVFFILLEYRYFSEKISLIFKEGKKRKEAIDIAHKIKWEIKSYFLVKAIISFLTWLFSYFLMIWFWLDFALIWAMLIFLLKFIPSIGPTISLLFPMALALVQYDNLYPFVFISLWLISIQTLMWSIIEPKIMWNKLNLSPLVIIISLWFWWTLWWVIWMLLSVPLMVIVNIILSKFDKTKPIAILLSEKWELDVSEEIEIDFENVKEKLWLNKI
jgi:predicted PurR-regulated permease PerM